MEDKQIRVLVMRREGYWIAQCLEHDIAAQAQGTFDDIIEELCRTLQVRLAACEAEKIDPFKLPAAPKMYYDLFDRAQLKRIDNDEIKLLPAFMVHGFAKADIRCQL